MTSVDASRGACGSETPTRLRLLDRGVRLSDRHGVRNVAEPPLRPLPNARSPLGPHDHGDLRDLRRRHDRSRC